MIFLTLFFTLSLLYFNHVGLLLYLKYNRLATTFRVFVFAVPSPGTLFTQISIDSCPYFLWTMLK